jgi:hypothetical protein
VVYINNHSVRAFADNHLVGCPSCFFCCFWRCFCRWLLFPRIPRGSKVSRFFCADFRVCSFVSLGPCFSISEGNHRVSAKLPTIGVFHPGSTRAIYLQCHAHPFQCCCFRQSHIFVIILLLYTKYFRIFLTYSDVQ